MYMMYDESEMLSEWIQLETTSRSKKSQADRAILYF